jgi:hypothetical protein
VAYNRCGAFGRLGVQVGDVHAEPVVEVLADGLGTIGDRESRLGSNLQRAATSNLDFSDA